MCVWTAGWLPRGNKGREANDGGGQGSCGVVFSRILPAPAFECTQWFSFSLEFYSHLFFNVCVFRFHPCCAQVSNLRKNPPPSDSDGGELFP